MVQQDVQHVGLIAKALKALMEESTVPTAILKSGASVPRANPFTQYH